MILKSVTFEIVTKYDRTKGCLMPEGFDGWRDGEKVLRGL